MILLEKGNFFEVNSPILSSTEVISYLSGEGRHHLQKVLGKTIFVSDDICQKSNDITAIIIYNSDMDFIDYFYTDKKETAFYFTEEEG